MDKPAKRRAEEPLSTRGGRDGKAARTGPAGSPRASGGSPRAAAPFAVVTLSSEDQRMREKVTALLSDALSGGSGDANRQKARAIATENEQGVFAHEGCVSAEYKKQFQMLKFNLTKNANLRDDVMTGEDCCPQTRNDERCRPGERGSKEEA